MSARLVAHPRISAVGPERPTSRSPAPPWSARCPGPASHEANRARILAFVDDHPDALHRSCARGPPHRLGRGRRSRAGGCCCCSTPRSSGGSNRAATPTATPTSPRSPAARREEETGIAGLAVVTPADRPRRARVPQRAGTEPDHLHLDVRHLVLAPPGAVPDGQPRVRRPRVGRASRTFPRYDVDAGHPPPRRRRARHARSPRG